MNNPMKMSFLKTKPREAFKPTLLNAKVCVFVIFNGHLSKIHTSLPSLSTVWPWIIKEIKLCCTTTHIILKWYGINALKVCWDLWGYFLPFWMAQIYELSAIVCLLKFTLFSCRNDSPLAISCSFLLLSLSLDTVLPKFNFCKLRNFTSVRCFYKLRKRFLILGNLTGLADWFRATVCRFLLVVRCIGFYCMDTVIRGLSPLPPFSECPGCWGF